jgi:hypothetical protein
MPIGIVVSRGNKSVGNVKITMTLNALRQQQEGTTDNFENFLQLQNG